MHILSGMYGMYGRQMTQAIEAIQRMFTYKTHLSTTLKPAMGHKIKIRNDQRHGTQRVIEYPTNRNPAQSIQENAITVFGPRLIVQLAAEISEMHQKY